MIKKIFITGASSGLGWALAKGYDSENNILGLVGRNKENLLKLQKQLNCRSQVLVADVAKPNSMLIAANTFKKKYGSPDIVIANAGVSSGTLASKKEDLEVIHKIFQINFHGVLNTFNPFMDDLLKSKQGQLVAIASVAGIRGLPGGGAYSASKSALINYMESIRVELKKFNIHVTTISPGYIKTPMTKINTYPMPFLIDAEQAATKIIHIIDKKKSHAILPWQMSLVAKIMHILPNYLWDFLAKNGPKKKRNIL